MKYCKYCGKQLHEQASFCPYCMNSQIVKITAIAKQSKTKKYFIFILMLVLLIIIGILIFVSLKHKMVRLPENLSSATIISEATTEVRTETVITATVKSTQTQTTEILTVTEPAARISVVEEINLSETYTIGEYISADKTYSQILGYGKHENSGGIVMTIEEITNDSITFSLVKYSESGLATDTVSARNITAEIIDNTATFRFSDMLDGKGTGIITFENDSIHIQTFSDESTERPTSIIINEWVR